MSLRQVAVLGYGITDFNYKEDMKKRITINFFDDDTIKNYLIEHPMKKWMLNLDDDLYDNIDTNLWINKINSLEKKYGESYIDELSHFIQRAVKPLPSGGRMSKYQDLYMKMSMDWIMYYFLMDLHLHMRNMIILSLKNC